MLDLIEGWLRHKSDMVNLEAARVICEMKNVTSQQLQKPIAGQYLSWDYAFDILTVSGKSFNFSFHRLSHRYALLPPVHWQPWLWRIQLLSLLATWNSNNSSPTRTAVLRLMLSPPCSRYVIRGPYAAFCNSTGDRPEMRLPWTVS